jgi:fructose-1,6-bisphosphatase
LAKSSWQKAIGKKQLAKSSWQKAIGKKFSYINNQVLTQNNKQFNNKTIYQFKL